MSLKFLLNFDLLEAFIQLRFANLLSCLKTNHQPINHDKFPPAFWVIPVNRVDMLWLNTLQIVGLRLIVVILSLCWVFVSVRWIRASFGRKNLVDCRPGLWFSVRIEFALEKICQNLLGNAILSLDLMLIALPYKDTWKWKFCLVKMSFNVALYLVFFRLESREWKMFNGVTESLRKRRWRRFHST